MFPFIDQPPQPGQECMARLASNSCMSGLRYLQISLPWLKLSYIITYIQPTPKWIIDIWTLDGNPHKDKDRFGIIGLLFKSPNVFRMIERDEQNKSFVSLSRVAKNTPNRSTIDQISGTGLSYECDWRGHHISKLTRRCSSNVDIDDQRASWYEGHGNHMAYVRLVNNVLAKMGKLINLWGMSVLLKVKPYK